MDSLLIILIVTVLAALSNWLQHRAQSRQEPPPDQDSTVPPQASPRRRRILPPAPPQPETESTLERELRRLLGEMSPPPSRPPPSPLPPAPSPVRMPPAAPPPVIRQMPREMPPLAPAPMAVAPPLAAELDEARTALERARQLHESVARRLQAVDEQTEKHGPRRRLPQPELVRRPAFVLPRDPRSARQAFVASLIFGTPKGLEP